MDVSFSAIMAVAKTVLFNKYVIITAVCVFLYLDFVVYVQHYHKKPPKVRTARHQAPAPAAAAAPKDGEQAASSGDGKTAEAASASSSAPAEKKADEH